MRLELPGSGGYFLSPVSLADLPAIVHYLQDPSIAETTPLLAYPYYADHARRWIRLVEEATPHAPCPVAFAVRQPENEFIGAIGFEGLSMGVDRAGIGYWLARPFWGKGIMTAAVAALCELAFQQASLRSLSAEVFVSNAASARVLEKNGFVREGGRPYPVVKNDRLVDTYRFWKHARIFSTVDGV